MTKKAAEQEAVAERYDALSELRKLKALAQEFGINIPLKSGFTPDDLNEVLPLLRYKIDDVAIQETDGKKTGKGYDTTGYSYQAHIDRMNWVFGPAHWRWRIENERIEEGQTSGQYPKRKFTCYGDIVVEIGYQEKDQDIAYWRWVRVWEVPPYPTDHESLELGSARKGALTKGLKRATSTLGVGADAWLGIFDDDLITGAQEGESMASAAEGGRRGSATGTITERDHEYLLKTAQRKGFTPEHLQTWLREQTDTRIDKELTMLTNAEFEEAKNLLFTIPQGRTIQDVIKSQEKDRDRPQDDAQTAAPRDNTHTDAATQENGRQEATEEAGGEPRTVEELAASPDDRIRELAKKYNLVPPPTLTATNRKPFCKALGAIMKIA